MTFLREDLGLETKKRGQKTICTETGNKRGTTTTGIKTITKGPGKAPAKDLRRNKMTKRVHVYKIGATRLFITTHRHQGA